MRSIFLAACAALACSVALAQSNPAATAASRPASKAVKPAGDPLKGLVAKHDKMRNLTFYKHKTSPKFINSSGFFLYFGKNDDGTFLPMRLVVRYFGDDWLFVKRAWAKADGATVDIPAEGSKLFGWERDNASGDVWEWSDTDLSSPQEIAVVRQIANAKSVTVRFEGKQYYKDKNLSAQQLQAMREVIQAYEAATGKPWK